MAGCVLLPFFQSPRPDGLKTVLRCCSPSRAMACSAKPPCRLPSMSFCVSRRKDCRAKSVMASANLISTPKTPHAAPSSPSCRREADSGARAMVGVRCLAPKAWTVYVPVQVRIAGNYLVTARQLTPGQVVTSADLRAQSGDLGALPASVVTDPAQAIGKTVRNGHRCAGQPLRSDLLSCAMARSARAKRQAAVHRRRVHGQQRGKGPEQRHGRPDCAGANRFRTGRQWRRPKPWRRRGVVLVADLACLVRSPLSILRK
jgi:hypothetical protein